MSAKNSARDRASSRSTPSSAEVIVVACGVRTPRSVMQVSGLVAGLGAGPVVDVVLEPHRGECCVELHAARPEASDG